MIFPSNQRSSFVLSITLTELALILFFLLLFAAVREIRAAEEKYEILNQTMTTLSESISMAPDSLLLQLKMLREMETMQEELELLNRRLAEAENSRAGLEILLREREKLDDDDFIELIRAAANNMGVIDQVSFLQERLGDMERTLANCTAQNLNCSRRLRESGLGFPPCWVSEEGKPEYIYAVLIKEETFEVTPIWPAHREREVDQIPGARELAGRTVTRQELSRFAQPILDWSKSQVPECRHYVVIDDDDNMSKNAFKANLLLVENFFYKYLTP